MKNLYKIAFTALSFFFIVLSVQTVSAQAVLETTASMVDATIYSSGASLHHIVKPISIPKGNSELVINQVSRNVNPESIRITANNSQISILSVYFEKDYLAKGENQSTAFLSLKKQFEFENIELGSIVNARKAEESALGLLEQNRNFGGDNGVSPASISAMIKYHREEYKTLATNILKLKTKEEEQQKVVNKLMQQMQEAGGSGQNAGQLVVRLNSSLAIETGFDIVYYTNNVSWSPFYEIRVDNLEQDLQLAYKANVSQNTGIDWKQVKLIFSSGNPQRNNNAPELQPWWLRFAQPIVMNSRPTAGRGELKESISLEVMEDSEEMTTVEDNQLSTSFVVNTPYDIYNNQKPQAVQLKDYRLPAKYSYFTAPRLDEGAFLIAKITDWAKYNLLPGSANLIIDNNYAGSSHINPNSTNDTLTLSLGRDERIITKRERVDEEGSNSFFGKSTTRIYKYEISVRNSRKETININVKEQFPLSTEKDIEIKLLETSNAQVNKEKGELSWNLSLKAGETKKLKIEYSIKSPKDKPLSGI